MHLPADLLQFLYESWIMKKRNYIQRIIGGGIYENYTSRLA